MTTSFRDVRLRLVFEEADEVTASCLNDVGKPARDDLALWVRAGGSASDPPPRRRPRTRLWRSNPQVWADSGRRMHDNHRPPPVVEREDNQVPCPVNHCGVQLYRWQDDHRAL